MLCDAGTGFVCAVSLSALKGIFINAVVRIAIRIGAFASKFENGNRV